MNHYTVETRNTLLGKYNYTGIYETASEAARYAMQQAARSRSFCLFSVCKGTPGNPGASVAGPLKGECR